MLRPITGSLLRKQESLNTQSSATVVVRRAVQEYLQATYPDAVATVSVRYDEQERLVVISTPSKSLAGELTLNARELRAHLVAQNVRVSRIIAR